MKRVLSFLLLFCLVHSSAIAGGAVVPGESPDSASVAASAIPVVVERDDSSDFVKDDFNLYGIIALVFAVLSFFIALAAWIAQSRTEKHTKNVPVADQREKFKALSRLEYRNLCCALASAIRFFDEGNGPEKKRKGYPSESNLQKLKIQPEDIVLGIDSSTASLISEMCLLLRNYNIEIDVTAQHLARKNISNETIRQDFDSILFKPMYLVKMAYDLEIALVNSGARKSQRINRNLLLEQTVRTILHEHLSRVVNSLPRFAESGLTDYIRKIDEVDGYKYPFADYTDAIQSSLTFLLQADSRQKLLTTLKLTKETRDSITAAKEAVDTVRVKSPEVYSHILNYRKMLDSMLESAEIDFTSFFPTMLAVDAISETVNIGMVNYE